MHISGSKHDAEQAIDEAARFLLDVNKKSEGIYLIEHLLLAPPYEGNYFGFSFNIVLSGTSKLKFNHIKKSTFQDRNYTIREIEGKSADGTNRLNFKVILVDEKYVIRAFSPEGEQLAQTAEDFTDKLKADNWVTQLTNNPDDNIQVEGFQCFAEDGAGAAGMTLLGMAREVRCHLSSTVCVLFAKLG